MTIVRSSYALLLLWAPNCGGTTGTRSFISFTVYAGAAAAKEEERRHLNVYFILYTQAGAVLLLVCPRDDLIAQKVYLSLLHFFLFFL